jgi:ribosomal protein S12 methylthiotransferase accessory factor YcaO
MKQLAYITQGQSDYDERLRTMLEESGIDPHEFVGLDAHGTDAHVTGVRVTVPEELEDAFLATLPAILDDAYTDEQ